MNSSDDRDRTGDGVGESDAASAIEGPTHAPPSTERDHIRPAVTMAELLAPTSQRLQALVGSETMRQVRNHARIVEQVKAAMRLPQILALTKPSTDVRTALQDG